MAQGEKENKADDEKNNMHPPLKPKKGKKKKKWLIWLIILVLLVGGGLLFKEPIVDFLRTVPVIGAYMPPLEEEEEDFSKEELMAIKKVQEKELEALQNEIESLEIAKEDLEVRNETLLQYEANYVSFMEDKSNWETTISEEHPTLFIEQFEKIYPDQASEIYRLLKGNEVVTKRQEELAKVVGEMDEDQAAGALEQLLMTDEALVTRIMTEMKDEYRSSILSSMNSKAAAQVIQLISP